MSAFEGLHAGHYSAILADPPWRFKTWSETRQTRSASNHYGVMEQDDIRRLPVADLAAPDCALFLWAINPMLPQALETIEAWGFVYKARAFTWAKRSRTGRAWHFGLGHWTRQGTESVLLATRGKPKRLSRAVPELIEEPVREHSRKPECVYERIERLVAGPYAELFARSTRPGWDSWGNETTKWAGAA